MIFTTHWFFLFVAVFFPVYWALTLPRLRAVALLAACAVFHVHFAGPAGMLPICVLALVTYACGLSRRPWLCRLAICICVGALVFYKYILFFSNGVLGALDPALGQAAIVQAKGWLPAAPPLAISFFVFEFVHYLVDVGRGGEPIRRPIEFGIFAIFFPSLVAGPIKRYQDFTASLRSGLDRIELAEVAAGAQRVALGFVKKLLVADNLTAGISFYDKSFAALSPTGAWLLLAALGARIFFDFSGYSDIAIGLARMMGLRLPENFNWPFLATSLQGFWQRWHISLSSWIRDYVYIPLGGSRHGPARRLLNGLLAFAICGVWHGAAWNFVLWGLWHGLGLAINAGYRDALGPFGERLARGFARWPALGWLLTLPFVTFGWLLFFYEPARAAAMAAKLLSFR